MFATHLAEFDAVIRLDAWKTKILLAAKRRLQVCVCGGGGDCIRTCIYACVKETNILQMWVGARVQGEWVGATGVMKWWWTGSGVRMRTRSSLRCWHGAGRGVWWLL